ncbi:NUDIX domain-containing protein [Actinoplanes sp. NBRC 103695]|uniref:NUDIX hydrolase n=1 Tax=Actinoplanes sp. NBRC 103695 TaxID=3032202 RepID=UPI0024A0F539|nr:NUDIX domain-containing protein [Actinoplanes sp. NBRC 103695]GLZ01098.1 NUDIX hydrolase [Actinoplanes sp. NBRC 103695]
MTALHDDAVRVLTGWVATSAEAEKARLRTLDLLAAGPVAMTREHAPGHVTASTMIARPDGRLLLCLHGRLNMWMQVGGHCEPGDVSLVAAAAREAREESGIAGLDFDPVPIDLHIHPVPCKPSGQTHHFDVRFLAVAPADAVELVSDESAALGWFRPDALPEPLADGVTGQIGPAMARLRSGG